MGETKNETMQETNERNFALVEKEATADESYESGSIQYIDSREVAEMVGKDHRKLLRDIRNYINTLDEINKEQNPKTKIGLSDFFIKSSYYVEGQSRAYPCYKVTLKGCEFIAHKLTGKKGTEFTARYINRFHEMKDELADNSGISAEMVNTLTEFVKQQAETNRIQAEFNKMVTERLEKLEEKKTGCKGNPYEAIEENSTESRKKELYSLTAKVAELCNSSHTRILHQMYRTLEEKLGIVLDSYKSVYRSKTGWQDASMVEVIASDDWLYEKAVDMNKFVIERKRIYG